MQSPTKSVPRSPGGSRSEKGKGNSFRAPIADLESRSKSAEVTETEMEGIVEELDKVQPALENLLARSEASQLMQRIQDEEEKGYCLKVLADVCRRHVILPKSYKISDIELEDKREPGKVSDIWTGKLRQEDVCVKFFRQHNAEDGRKIEGVGRSSFGGNTALSRIITGVLPPSSAVEECFASQRTLFPGSLLVWDASFVWLSHPPDVEQHQGLHKGPSR